MNDLPVALVTGSSRGLGRSIAQCCARAGYSVGLHFAHHEAAAREALALCRDSALYAAQQFVLVRGNLGVAAERAGIFEQTLSAFGRLDALINNAGMAPRARADITETTEASYDEVMGVNLKGPFFLSQLAANYWLEHEGQSRLSGGYKLIFVTSVSADTASVNRGEYCLSKAGLSMAAQLWTVRLADHSVQVFEIRPGIIATDMTAGARETHDRLIAAGGVPQQRWGRPEEVGMAAASILAGHFPFSTGSVIHVDGALHVRRL